MNHDVAAEFGSPVFFRLRAVELIWEIDAQRQMKRAVGIERFDAIKTFGNLKIAITQLRPQLST